MTNPPVGPRFRLAPGVVLRGGRRPPLPPAPAPDARSERHEATGDGATGHGATGHGATGHGATGHGATGHGATGDGDPEAPAGFRNTRWDRSALAVSIDPTWLLAPLFARDAGRIAVTGDGLPGPLRARPPEPAIPDVPGTADDPEGAAARDWPGWWRAALAYRPGTPAPRQPDLIAGSAALQRLWSRVEEPFGRWLAARPPRDPASDGPARDVERAALSGFAARTGRDPGRWTVRILEIPVTGGYLHSPEGRRIVVAADLRADPDRYAAALAAELPRHF